LPRICKSSLFNHSDAIKLILIHSLLKDVGRSGHLNLSVLYCLAECGLPPAIVNRPAFRNMIQTAAKCGAAAKLGSRHQFARLGRSGNKFGVYLETGLKEVEQLKVKFFADAKLSGYAINLLSDVAKNIQQSTNATIAQGISGCVHLKHTNPGAEKKTGEWLCNDLITTIEAHGSSTFFLSILDGASSCKKGNRLLHEKYPGIFPLRCQPHGYNILASDIGLLFKLILRLCLRLVIFINSHEKILHTFLQDGAAALAHPAVTRFAKEVLTAQCIQKDKFHLQRLWLNPAVHDIVTDMSAPLQKEFKELNDLAIMESSFWHQLSVFIEVVSPIMLALRVTDSNTANLHLLASIFYKLKAECPAIAASQKVLGAPVNVVYKKATVPLEKAVLNIIEGRSVDCLPDVIRAASFVNPDYLWSTEIWTCPGAGPAYFAMLRKYIDSHESDQAKRDSKMAEAMVEMGLFRKGEGWFSDASIRLLAKHSDDGAMKLWTSAIQFEIAPISGPLNLKLSTSVSGIGQCERHHKSTQQHRTKYSNRKLAGTTAAYCEIKMAKNTERKNADKVKKSLFKPESDSVLASFNTALLRSGKLSNERKIAREAIDISRRARQILHQGNAVLWVDSFAPAACDVFIFLFQMGTVATKVTALKPRTQTWR
jgi:hypothetical protein